MAKYDVVSLGLDQEHKLIGFEHLARSVQSLLYSGPVIYIYRSQKSGQRYIGQTKQFVQRNLEHYSGQEEKFNQADFDEVVVLYSRYFNRSALDDVEAQLITYFKSDATAHQSANKAAKSVTYEDADVINRTNGNTVNDYAEQEAVATEVVLPFWENYLYPKGWVNIKTLEELRTKALVKYSPIKTLTHQQNAIIQEVIANPTENFVINGDAGTGKTVLLTNLVARLMTGNHDLRVAVVVQPNWVKTATEIFKVYGLTQSRLTVTTSVKLISKDEPYDVIVVDEAHKLSRRGSKQMFTFNKVYDNAKYAEAEDHLQILKQLGHQVVLMYDVLQAIRPANIPRAQFKADTEGFQRRFLSTQFRIQAGNHSQYSSDDYINGIKYLLYKDTGMLESEDTGFDPDFNRGVFRESSPDAYFGYFTTNPLHMMIDWLDHERNLHPEYISRVLGGLSVPWTIQQGRDPKKFQWFEGDLSRRWNSTQENWLNVDDEDAEDQIGSVFAVQGIDLNQVGVLIGNDLGVDSQGHLYGVRKNFHNTNGRFTEAESKEPANQAEFTLFVLNIYYVLLTRGIDGIRIGFWHNPGFQEYFEKTLIND